MRKGRPARGAFSSLLHEVMRREKLLDNRAPGACGAREQKLTLLRLSVSKNDVVRLTGLLNRHLYPCLRSMCFPVPAECISGVLENYAEQLPKTMRFKTALLASTRSMAYQAADFLGILELLRSEEVRSLAEQVSRRRLVPSPGCQIICYEAGDFIGPHTDHHPEQSHLRDGYVEVHFLLPELGVKSQMIIYEQRRGLINAVEEVGRDVAVAVYQLPFWHQVTPLIPRDDTRQARRWLLLASYEIDRQ